MEREIAEAIGLSRPQVVPEPELKKEPEPSVTIYDFGKLLDQNEPPHKTAVTEERSPISP